LKVRDIRVIRVFPALIRPLPFAVRFPSSFASYPAASPLAVFLGS
jgi:hypothetical protein